MRDSLIGVVGPQFASLTVVLPPLSPRGSRDPSEPVVDIHFDDITSNGRAKVLGSFGFDPNAISFVVFERCENEVALRAAEIIRAEGRVVESEWLGWGNRLRG